MASEREKLPVLLGLCEMFSRELTEAATGLYLDGIDDLSVDDFRRAATWAIRNCKFFPTVAEIREAAGKGEASREDRAIRAWVEAWAAASDVGAWRSVEFTDPVTARTIAAMGGWPAFCRSEQGEQWRRKEFLETYRGLAGDVEADAPLRLPGLHERGGGVARVIVIGSVPDRPRLTTQEPGDFKLLGEVARRARESQP